MIWYMYETPIRLGHGQAFVAVTRARTADATTFIIQHRQQYLKNPLNAKVLSAMGREVAKRTRDEGDHEEGATGGPSAAGGGKRVKIAAGVM